MREELTDEAREARRAYHKEYSIKNRARLNEYHKAWRRDNPEKVSAAQARYWERKAKDYYCKKA